MRDWELVNAALYKGEGNDRNDNHIEQVLNLSYQDLPHYLKLCFLYLGTLKENESIYVHDLYRMWIAQGILSYENIQGKDETLMEIAELYLTELASRCIVRVELEDDAIPTLKYSTRKLHDVVRELCISIGKKEDFGVQILEYRDGKFSTLLQEALSCIKTRHLVIHFQRELQLEHDEDDLVMACEEDSSKHLRSLEIQSDINWNSTIEFPSQSIVDLQNFKMLRSLVIVRFKFVGRKLPRGTTNLVHLKYLRLQQCELDKLPSTISHLAYLDTLHLFQSWNVRVPNVLKKMLRLKHLFLPRYDMKTIGKYRQRLDVGDELETLMWFDSSVHELQSITSMRNLRCFSAVIRDNESLSTIINAIAKWAKLLYCVVIIGQGCELTMSDDEEGRMKLKQVFTCPNLYYLEIYVELGELLAKCRSDIIGSKLVSLILLECKIEEDPMGDSRRGFYLEILAFVLEVICRGGDEMSCTRFSTAQDARVKSFTQLEGVESGARSHAPYF